MPTINSCLPYIQRLSITIDDWLSYSTWKTILAPWQHFPKLNQTKLKIIPVIGNLLNSHPFRVLGYIFSPLMCFLNALVFLMPKCIKYQNNHPGTWLLMAYICVIFRSPVRLSLRSKFIAIKRRDSTQSASTSTNPRQSLQPVDIEG